ncbi:hypothetical protein BDV27DRAFT_40370 [Aspergillus caelatus]|uniref:C2H2-type domain-containing protein n=1 Tax=Aspergillus caelatus TaxID=61420 RepID=A0A5N7AFH2_9EURO|nr:uncharacterized protein BDV27DRAFT_40370 [Aspergillus caelatus]KAE8368572.1 hypothetical protein BDV27DRAFT_40370 [Aspergillus caelatus]
MSHRQWLCSVCSAHFTRMEHLRRHLRSHDNERPYACALCQRTFTRKDAMKRHEKTCKAQPSVINALDTLASTYNRGNSNSANETLFQNTDLDVAHEDACLANIPASSDFEALDLLYSQDLTPDSTALAGRLEFLAYFTSANGMATFLDQDTLKQWQKMLLEHERHIEMYGYDCDATGLRETCHSAGIQVFTNSWGNTFETTIDPSVVHMTSDDSDLLFLRTQEIIHDLQALVARKADQSIIELDWSPSVQESCSTLFAPNNMRRFLGYFWSLWYPNCPIVHRPSFNPQTAPLTLLCVMVIIGACLSPRAGDGLRARMWLDTVEELVFSNEVFQEKPAMTTTTPPILEGQTEWKKRRVECLQMTYLICSLQKREGSINAQARSRRYRHAMMVTLVRDIGLSASHRDLELKEPSGSWWRKFIVEEERIRSLLYVFCIDSAITMLHNSPPRMVVSELKMDIACPEECFQAGSATECFTALSAWKDSIFWRERLSMSSVVKWICQRSLDDHLVHEFSRMGTLNMCTLVLSLHSLIFSLQNSLIFESTFTPVQTGLENWGRIWNKRIPEDRYTPDNPHTIWKKIGFVRYAAEFWHLARIIVARVQSGSLPRTQKESSRYDHTDMVDVNGLIMEYRRMSLSAPPLT